MSFHHFLEKHFGLVNFSVLGLFVIPSLFYQFNVESFDRDLFLMLLPLGCTFLVLSLSLFKQFSIRTQAVLCGYGLSILLSDQFFRAPIRHLDGASGIIEIEPISATIGVILYFGLPLYFGIFKDKHKKILIDLSYVSLGLLLFLSGYVTVLSIGEAEQKTKTIQVEKTGKKLPNVYFLWLDQMETDYFYKSLLESGADKKFGGFSFFKNNTSNYLYTQQSYPSFMSGTIYKTGDSKQWYLNSRNQLRKILKNKGYYITSYAKTPFITQLDDVSTSSKTILTKGVKSTHFYVSDFVTYWVVRLMPGAFANGTIRNSKIIGDKAHEFFNPKSQYSDVKSISDGVEPLSGMLTLKKITKDEEGRSGNGNFLLIQSLLPHGPNVIDKNCKYRGLTNIKESDAYFEQVQCATKLTVDFLAKLKELGRYDSSVIVIMGDHGAGWVGPIDGFFGSNEPLNKNYTPWTESMIFSRASAALMIKPAGRSKTDPFNVSEKETQLIDIFPSILSSVGIKVPKNIDGRDVFGTDETKRAKYISYFKPGTYIPNKREFYDLTLRGETRGISQREYQ